MFKNCPFAMSWRRIQYAKGANNATISIVRIMYFVILENIRGDFSDNTSFLAFKLRIIFKNIGRSVRTVPCKAPTPSSPPPTPYDPTLVVKQQTMLKLSWNANKHRNIQAKLYRQLVCQFWIAFLVPCLGRKWGHRLNCKTLYLSWSVSLFIR